MNDSNDNTTAPVAGAAQPPVRTWKGETLPPDSVNGDPVVYKGRQWMVFASGDMDTLRGTYWIEGRDLTESFRSADDAYAWPITLAEEANWIDYEDFCEAFLVALGQADREHSPDAAAKGIALGYEALAFRLFHAAAKYWDDAQRGELRTGIARVRGEMSALEKMGARVLDLRDGAGRHGRVMKYALQKPWNADGGWSPEQ